MADNTTSSNHQNQALVTVSVSDFFQQINWSGIASPEANEEFLSDTPYETVGQFFATFPWQSSMGAPSNQDDWELSISDDEITFAGDDSLTLEDLSALF